MCKGKIPCNLKYNLKFMSFETLEEVEDTILSSVGAMLGLARFEVKKACPNLGDMIENHLFNLAKDVMTKVATNLKE
jgi:hypothetical protein